MSVPVISRTAQPLSGHPLRSSSSTVCSRRPRDFTLCTPVDPPARHTHSVHPAGHRSEIALSGADGRRTANGRRRAGRRNPGQVFKIVPCLTPRLAAPPPAQRWSPLLTSTDMGGAGAAGGRNLVLHRAMPSSVTSTVQSRVYRSQSRATATGATRPAPAADSSIARGCRLVCCVIGKGILGFRRLCDVTWASPFF